MMRRLLMVLLPVLALAVAACGSVRGCVRILMDVAGFFHTLVPTPGTPVYIRR